MERQCDTCRFGGDTQRGCMVQPGTPRYRPTEGCPLYAMSAQAFLRRVAGAQRRIVHMEEQAARYRDMALRTTAGLQSMYVKSSFGASKTEDNVTALMDISQEIGREAERLRGILTETNLVLGLMRIPEEREVIELRYLSGLSWMQIADRMFLSERTVRRLHIKALANVQLAMDALEYSRHRPGWNPQGGAARAGAVVQ